MKGHLSELGYELEAHDARIAALRGLTDIADVIERVVQIYEDLYEQDAYEINCGNCEEFSRDVLDLLGGETDTQYAVWHDNMPDCTTRESMFWSHCFIYYQGRFYDAEAPEGVDNWRDLPAFQNNPLPARN